MNTRSHQAEETKDSRDVINTRSQSNRIITCSDFGPDCFVKWVNGDWCQHYVAYDEEKQLGRKRKINRDSRRFKCQRIHESISNPARLHECCKKSKNESRSERALASNLDIESILNDNDNINVAATKNDMNREVSSVSSIFLGNNNETEIFTDSANDFSFEFNDNDAELLPVTVDASNIDYHHNNAYISMSN
jgi:hypothetical protein